MRRVARRWMIECTQNFTLVHLTWATFSPWYFTMISTVKEYLKDSSLNKYSMDFSL